MSSSIDYERLIGNSANIGNLANDVANTSTTIDEKITSVYDALNKMQKKDAWSGDLAEIFVQSLTTRKAELEEIVSLLNEYSELLDTVNDNFEKLSSNIYSASVIK